MRFNLKTIFFLLCIASFLSFAIYKFFVIHVSMFHQDFVVFWTAADMTLSGRVGEIYDTTAMFAAERAVEPRLTTGIVFPYPPTFLLINAPLALTSVHVAYWCVLLATMVPFVYVYRKIIGGYGWVYWLGLLAFPPIWENMYNGHYAFLTAALAGGAILSINRQYKLAGFLIGLLFAIKPHLAILFPVALMAIRMWQPLLVALLTLTGFWIVSVVLFGIDVVPAFMGLLNPDNIHAFISHVQDIYSTPTIFALFKTFDVPDWVSYMAHLLAMGGATAAVFVVWRKSENERLRGAVLMSATLLMSPHIGLYDLVWLAFPMAWMAVDMQDRNGTPQQIRYLVLIWFLLLFIFGFGNCLGFYSLSLIVLAFLLFVVHRAVTPGTHQAIAP